MAEYHVISRPAFGLFGPCRSLNNYRRLLPSFDKPGPQRLESPQNLGAFYEAPQGSLVSKVLAAEA